VRVADLGARTTQGHGGVAAGKVARRGAAGALPVHGHLLQVHGDGGVHWLVHRNDAAAGVDPRSIWIATWVEWPLRGARPDAHVGVQALRFEVQH